MGCGVSKLDHEEAGPKFKCVSKRSDLHSNIENDNTLGSDLLLHEYGAIDEPFPGRKINKDRKNVTFLTITNWELDVQDQVNAKNNNGGGAYAGGSKDQLGGVDRKFKVTVEEEKRSGDGRGDDNSSERDKQEEENGSFSQREDDIALPGSPSFREYCVYSRKDFNEDKGAKEETNKAEAERSYLNSEMAQGSEAEASKRRRSPTRGIIKSAMQRPAGWIQRQK